METIGEILNKRSYYNLKDLNFSNSIKHVPFKELHVHNK